jgi:hypothetical protein
LTADSQPMPISAQPSPPKAPPVQQRIGLFLLWAGLWVVLLLGVSWAGYQSGLADRNVLAATQSYQELERQYELAILDLAAQRPQTALETVGVHPNANARFSRFARTAQPCAAGVAAKRQPPHRTY